MFTPDDRSRWAGRLDLRRWYRCPPRAIPPPTGDGPASWGWLLPRRPVAAPPSSAQTTSPSPPMRRSPTPDGGPASSSTVHKRVVGTAPRRPSVCRGRPPPAHLGPRCRDLELPSPATSAVRNRCPQRRRRLCVEHGRDRCTFGVPDPPGRWPRWRCARGIRSGAGGDERRPGDRGASSTTTAEGPERWTYAALSAAAVATVPAWTRDAGPQRFGARLKAGQRRDTSRSRDCARAAMAHPAHEPHWRAELTRSDAPFSPRAAVP